MKKLRLSPQRRRAIETMALARMRNTAYACGISQSTPSSSKGAEQRKRRKPGRKLDEDEKIEVQQEYASGKTRKRIAEKYVVSERTVSRICKGVERRKIPKGGRKPQIDRKERVNILEEYADGKTQDELAETYVVSQDTVFKICKGVERRKKPKRKQNPEKEERNRRIREQYADGNTQRQIADLYGVSQITIRRICNGVERRELPKTGRKPRIGWEKRLDIREEYANGKTWDEIVKKYGVSQSTVFRICKEVERRKRRKPGCKLSKDEKEKIREGCAERNILTEMTGKYGTPPDYFKYSPATYL